jgi:hypothetical protein
MGISAPARVLIALVALASGDAPAEEKSYSPGVGRDYPQNVYWGDTHLHTRNSPDAYSLGNRNLSPEDAYRFARGQELVAHNSMKVRLRRPLDFLVVSDHGEFLGAYYRHSTGDPSVVETEVGKRWTQFLKEGEPGRMMAAFTQSIYEPDPNYVLPMASKRLIWQDVADTADRYNDPGKFTAFSGYEWTSMIDGNNLHRVLVFKDDAEKVGQIAPFSAQDSIDPEDLFEALEEYESKTGGEVLSIPHNGNLSNGLMFSSTTLSGSPLSRAYAETRIRWEPLYEVTQVKGDGEAHPFLSPDDEFADYETWDADNIGRTHPKEDWMLQHEYARSALKLGLKFESELGVNPFKFGIIGSTDSHTALATAAEDNFFGKFPESEPTATRTETHVAGRLWSSWRLASSGYAAVWARENTRESLFAAMKRKETYGTTGSRIVVRFFGGWEYADDDVDRPDYADIGYAKGVPMGGDLTRGPRGKAPSFMVVASKDPDGATLDRVQIVKGWLEKDGSLGEKVYDVALSDGRQVDAKTGKAPPVGSTVNVAQASYTNSIGDAQLAAFWSDPDFDRKQRAFYYVRVIEIPTPRWTTYDAKFFGIQLPAEVPLIQQDRAYTSAIWYTP